jgi:hypothetical protein
MSHNSSTLNGSAQRKTLASQLDRLDNIIDAIADGLPKAIADVVCQAISAALPDAIQGVITQVLSQPDVLRQLAGLNAPAAVPAPSEPASPPQPEPTAPSRSKLGAAWGWLRTKVSKGCSWVTSKLPGAGQSVWQHRYLVAGSLAIGVMVGCTSYMAGPVLSSLALGACGAMASAGAFIFSPFIRLWQNLRSPEQA